MRRYRFSVIVAVLVGLSLTACPSKQDGAIEGTVVPPTSGIQIAATQNGAVVKTVETDVETGNFIMALAPGMYDVKVTTPTSPFPLTFPAVVVQPAKTTTLPFIELESGAASSSLAGAIAPGGSDTHITLLYEGKERAGIRADSDGAYEFTGLAAGRYTMLVNAPGYAQDTVEFSIPARQRASQNMRLLYISNVDGVDWTKGTIKALGMGLPPKKAPNATIRRAMAKRAALADGQRNLLRTIEQIRVGPDQTLKELMKEKDYTVQVHGFIKGYRIVEERELDAGRIELVLELPLTGTGGLAKQFSF